VGEDVGDSAIEYAARDSFLCKDEERKSLAIQDPGFQMVPRRWKSD